MPHVLGIDRVAFAAHDLEATCAFYDRLLAGLWPFKRHSRQRLSTC